MTRRPIPRPVARSAQTGASPRRLTPIRLRSPRDDQRPVEHDPLPASVPFRWWQIAAYVIGAIISLAFIALQVAAVAAPISADDIRVIDGDTIRVHHQRPDVRLVGFNAPETRRARCAAEEELGAKATRRLRDLVRAGNLDLQIVPCACRPGTEGTDACNYGRRCGILKAGGRDVGSILIAEELAAPFQCGPTRCPRTPRPWCQ